MSRGIRLAARLAVAALLAGVATVGASSLSSAAPSQQDVREAQARIEQLNQHMSLLVEQYDQEQAHLQDIQARLEDARADAQRAHTTADRAMRKLNERAASVYTRIGSELEVLLGSGSFAEFSDRLEYVGSLAQADTDLATRAARARQKAVWAGQRLHDAMQEQQRALRAIRAKEAEIRNAIADAKAEYESINRRYHDYLDAQAAAAAAQQTAFTVSPPPGGPPPAPNPNAQAAVSAAYSVIGTPYVYGGSDPSVGFDCSGLTMWAWAHAGVSLPHSSAMQYAVLPHISPSDAQAGDLIFFYSPISHVGLYIGGGRMIDANHPGDVVNIRAVNWSYVTGAARP